jgi:hypothetical protein
VIGVDPLHEPVVAVRVWPCCGVPETVGTDVLDDAVGGGVLSVVITSSGARLLSREAKNASRRALGAVITNDLAPGPAIAAALFAPFRRVWARRKRT